jgi:hypothetical protein
VSAADGPICCRRSQQRSGDGRGRYVVARLTGTLMRRSPLRRRRNEGVTVGNRRIGPYRPASLIPYKAPHPGPPLCDPGCSDPLVAPSAAGCSGRGTGVPWWSNSDWR